MLPSCFPFMPRDYVTVLHRVEFMEPNGTVPVNTKNVTLQESFTT